MNDNQIKEIRRQLNQIRSGLEREQRKIDGLIQLIDKDEEVKK